VTAVVKVLRSSHDLGSHRVQVNVPHEFGEVLIALAEDRLVASLKQVADLSVLAIVILAIGGEEPLHHPADVVILSFDEQMNVIGHQAVGVKIEGQLGLLLGKLKEELAIVVVRAEDELTIVATGDDVIEAALDLDSRFAHRGLSLLRRRPICKLHSACLTPGPLAA
jgi:hypothetical protein